eukprot:scaffold17519_cov124-Isochrysis_galbana.AAC.6
MGSRAGCVSVEWATEGVLVLESLALSGSGDVLVGLRDLLCGVLMCLEYRHSCGCLCSTGSKRLDIAKIGHVGKNIRILSTDEH